MNKEEIERRRAEIELEKKIEMQRYEIQKNILNPIIATNNLENESDEQKVIIANNYLKQHMYEAEKRLRKIAYPNEEIYFLDINKIVFEWNEQKRTRGIWDRKNNAIKINNMFLYKCNFDDKFDEELIGVIQHEIIHVFIDEKCSKFGMNVSTDASPIHQSIVTFFNVRGCNIESNGNLFDEFQTYNKELYDFTANIETTFLMILDKLNRWQEKLMNKIEEYNEDTKNSVTIIAGFDKSAEKSYINSKPNIPKDVMECVAETVRKGFAKPTKFIELGMDCNLDDFEVLINKLIEGNDDKEK